MPLARPPTRRRHLLGIIAGQGPAEGREIQQKRSDTLNKSLPKPIPEFSPRATLGTMRKETGKASVEAVIRAARGRRP